jgi:hypothetical protein
MSPNVTQQNAIERASGKPDRMQAVEQHAQNRRRRHDVALSVARECIEQRARSRLRAEDFALLRQRTTQATQERGTALRSLHGIACYRADQRRELRRVKRRQRRRIDTPRIRWRSRGMRLA